MQSHLKLYLISLNEYGITDIDLKRIPISINTIHPTGHGLTEQLIPYSKNQSTFVKGRLIADNVLMTEELLWGYDQKGTPKRACCCCCLSLSKAFDSMRSMGFSNLIINMGLKCFTFASFSLVVEGEATDQFSRGRERALCYNPNWPKWSPTNYPDILNLRSSCTW